MSEARCKQTLLAAAALGLTGAAALAAAYALGWRSARVRGLPQGTAGALRSGSWFTELGPMWPGQGLSIECKKLLYSARSAFQDIAVFESEAFGTVMTLDGVIQITDRDEFSYQEMITHLPLCGLDSPPKKVLVVGGGDGGVLREITRHESVQVIDMAEIDGQVVEVSKKFFPDISVGFSDPRVTLRICDGIDFVRNCKEGTYDAIIVDSSDPVGPAEVLFEQPFFEYMHRVLRPGGIVCTQAESLWLHLPVITEVARMCSSVFKGGSVSYGYTTIPTYPSGQIGFMLCTKKGSKKDVKKAQRDPPGPGLMKLQPLRYYNKDIHTAAFVLPQYAKDALAPFLTG